jgi:hypothetical protein
MADRIDGLKQTMPGVPIEWVERLLDSDNTTDQIISDGLLPGVTDAQINLSGQVGTPTINSSSLLTDAIHSAGVITGGGINNNGDGTIDVAAGSGLIRSADDDLAPLLVFDWTLQEDVVLNNNELNYIYWTYNGGTPLLVVSLTPHTDHNRNVSIGTVQRDDTSLHPTESREDVGNAIHRLNTRLYATDGLTYASGALVGEVAPRNVSVTSGVFFLGLNEVVTSAFDSSGPDNLITFYRAVTPGEWVVNTAANQVSNVNYDDGSGTLGGLGSNQYGVHWIYVGVDDDVYVVYGRVNGNLLSAQAEQPYADLPGHLIIGHATLAGKFIVQEGTANAISVETAFTTEFAATGVTAHDDLTGLANDDHTQYLTEARHDTFLAAKTLLDFGGIEIVVVTADPNATITSPKGSLALDKTNATMWQNTDGGTTWASR